MTHILKHRHLAASSLLVAGLLAASACGGSTAERTAQTPGATLTTTTDTHAPPPTTPRETTTEAATSGTSAVVPGTTAPKAASSATMPNVVCMNLQAAQNAIQSAGVFFSRSRDATGQGRRQLIDSNWIVVEQSPSAGEPVTEGEAALSAVKIGEPSTC